MKKKGRGRMKKKKKRVNNDGKRNIEEKIRRKMPMKRK